MSALFKQKASGLVSDKNIVVREMFDFDFLLYRCVRRAAARAAQPVVNFAPSPKKKTKTTCDIQGRFRDKTGG